MKKGEMLEKMLIIMVNAHAGQYDKGGAPYALHPLAVMHYMDTDDEELLCIALGHDLFEDTKVTRKDILEAGMGQRIIEGIMCLTKMPGQTYEEYKTTLFSNTDAMKVKLRDLRHNSDIRRLKGKTVTEKDIARTVRYHRLYLEIEAKLAITE